MLVEHARHPVFYRDFHAADTIDGRFDIIILHLILILKRYKAANDLDMVTNIQNCFFRDMDRNLREMGVGDISVPKKIKKMAEAFMGRSKTYAPLLENRQSSELSSAFERNIEAAENYKLDTANLSAYALYIDEYMENIDPSLLKSGKFILPNPKI